MNIQDVKNRFQAVANANSDIQTFMFDDLSSINTDRQKKYPTVLMKTPSSVITPFNTGIKDPLMENYSLSIYILDTWNKEDKKTIPLEQRYKEVEVIFDKYLREVLNQGGNEYYLVTDKSVSKERGHHQHVDQLVGVNYTFTLRVFNSLCTSLGLVGSLNVTSVTATTVNLGWNDLATGEDGFEVFRSTDFENWILAGTTVADATSFSDTGLNPGDAYAYRVRAVSPTQKGEWSNIVIGCTEQAASPINVSNSNDSYDVDTLVDLELPDSFVSNSNDSFVVNLPATTDLELIDETIQVVDDNDIVISTVNNPLYENLTIEVPIFSNAASGWAYNNVQPTGAEVSYATGDDADSVTTYTPPSIPISFCKLDNNAVDPFITLLDNNQFGNKDRFTDEDGLQVYGNSYAIDHHTGLGWSTAIGSNGNWSTVIAAANTSTAYIYSDWRVANFNEAASILNRDVVKGILYVPFNAFDNYTIWLSTTISGSSVHGYYLATSSVTTGGAIWRDSKTAAYRSIMCRNHYV